MRLTDVDMMIRYGDLRDCNLTHILFIRTVYGLEPAMSNGTADQDIVSGQGIVKPWHIGALTTGIAFILLGLYLPA